MELKGNFKVRDLGSVEQKSKQEVEQELLEKKDKQEVQEQPEQEVVEKKEVEEKTEEPAKAEEQPKELEESEVLSYIEKRYGKEIKSLDDLTAERESQVEMPEDVAAYLKYKEKTGRGFEDYVKLNEDFNSLPEDVLLEKFYLDTKEAIDIEDVDVLLEDFDFDEEVDEPKEIKKKKLAKKKIIAKAKDYFEQQKEMYHKPLESSGPVISEQDAQNLEAYKQYVNSAKSYEEEAKKKSEWFTQKTDEVFSSEFKGFEFTLGENKITYAPGDAQELKKAQSNVTAFLNKFMDENGLMTDATGYHRALAIAMNPEKFASFFYEQGKSDATEDVVKKTKNVNMSIRQTPQVKSKGDGIKVRVLNPDSGRGLKIKSIKRK